MPTKVGRLRKAYGAKFCTGFDETLFNAILKHRPGSKATRSQPGYLFLTVAIGVDKYKQRSFVECCADCREC